MRILHIDSGKTWRGGQRQLYFLSKGLKELGIEQYALISNKQLKDKLQNLGIEVFSWKYKFEFHFGFFKYLRILKKVKPDIVHFHDSRSLSLSILTKQKSVATRRVDFHLKNRFSKIKYERTDLVVGVSKRIVEVLKDDGIKDVLLIYDGIDPDELKVNKTKEECRKMFGFKSSPVFVNVAALVDHKGHIYLLKALKILKDKGIVPEVHIAGDGELREDLLKYKENNKLSNVVFHGFVKEIAEFMYAGDFFIISSHLEGLGSSIIDAMALKLPVIATKAGGIPELIEGVSFLAKNKDPFSIAEKIKEAMNNREKAIEFSEKAYNLFLNKFHYKKLAESYKDIYDKLIRTM